jgi:HD superfamily phosphohydrolase
LDEFDGPFLFINRTDFFYEPFGDIYHDLTSVWEFFRLQGIKQLGTVSTSCPNIGQNQTRQAHSYVTGIMADIVLYRNGFSEHDRRLGIAAGLYHDLAICPYSDQGKLLKPGSYEEENLIAYVLKRSKQIIPVLRRYGLDFDELIAAIGGNGVVGRLINSREGLDVDNLSYLALDQMKLCSDDKPFAFEKKTRIFDQYNNLKFVDGVWVFDDPELVIELLTFRSLMYEHIYHNPLNRAKEAFFIRTLSGHHVSLDTLLCWMDIDFERWFEANFGQEKANDFFNLARQAFVEVGREYDLSQLSSLRAELETGDVIVEHMKPPRDATRNHVLCVDGSVRLLDEVYPSDLRLKAVKDRIKSLDFVGIYKKVDYVKQGGRPKTIHLPGDVVFYI